MYYFTAMHEHDLFFKFLVQYFHDKAISKEINHLPITCPHCSNWTGEYNCYQVSSVM